MISAWLAIGAWAGPPPGWIRAGRRISSTVAVVSIEVVGFEGGAFAAPSGEPIATPRWLGEVDLDAVADEVREALHTEGQARGLAVQSAPATGETVNAAVGVPVGFAPRRWHRGVPERIQPLLAPARGARWVVGVRVHLGWCADPSAPEGTDGVLCVRSPETSLGTGEGAVVGFGFRDRFDAPGRTVRSARPTLVAREVGYARRAGLGWGDPPILGSGDTWQAQAEDAARQAIRLWVEAASRR